MPTQTRNVDPAVAKSRSDVAIAVLRGDQEGAEQARRDLDRAKRMAAINSAVRKAPPITPAELGSIVATLASAVTDD